MLWLAVLLAGCSGAAAAQDPDDHDLLEVAVGGDHDLEDMPSPADRAVRIPTPSIAFTPRIEPCTLQGYLAHEKHPPQQDHHRSLGIGLL